MKKFPVISSFCTMAASCDPPVAVEIENSGAEKIMISMQSKT
jgi:hypothetical protein